MSRSTSILTITLSFAVLLLSVPVTSVAQEPATAELSTVPSAALLGDDLTATPLGSAIHPVEGAPVASVPTPRAEKQTATRQGVDVGGALVAIGGVLVAGALADYLASSPAWGMTAGQAGAFGSGAVLAAFGGLHFR